MLKSMLLIVAGLLLMSTTAMATPVTFGVNENGVGLFDQIELFQAGALTADALSGFNVGSWASTSSMPGYANARGTEVTDITFNVTYDSTSSFLIFALDKGRVVDQALWDGSAFRADQSALPAAPVPEPGTMMLLGAGFLGLAVYGKRRKNA